MWSVTHWCIPVHSQISVTPTYLQTLKYHASTGSSSGERIEPCGRIVGPRPCQHSFRYLGIPCLVARGIAQYTGRRLETDTYTNRRASIQSHRSNKRDRRADGGCWRHYNAASHGPLIGCLKGSRRHVGDAIMQTRTRPLIGLS